MVRCIQLFWEYIHKHGRDHVKLNNNTQRKSACVIVNLRIRVNNIQMLILARQTYNRL